MNRGYFACLFGLALFCGLLLVTRSEQLLELAMDAEPTQITQQWVAQAMWWDETMERAGIKPGVQYLRDRIESLKASAWGGKNGSGADS